MEAFVLRGSWGVPWPPLPGGWSLVELSCEETLRLCLLLTGEHDLFMYKGLNKPKDNSKGSAKMLLSFFFFFSLYVLMHFLLEPFLQFLL